MFCKLLRRPAAIGVSGNKTREALRGHYLNVLLRYVRLFGSDLVYPRVQVAAWCISKPERGSCRLTFEPMYVPYLMLGPFGMSLPAEMCHRCTLALDRRNARFRTLGYAGHMLEVMQSRSWGSWLDWCRSSL